MVVEFKARFREGFLEPESVQKLNVFVGNSAKAATARVYKRVRDCCSFLDR